VETRLLKKRCAAAVESESLVRTIGGDQNQIRSDQSFHLNQNIKSAL